MVSFEDRAPNVKEKPLPAHGNSSVNMLAGPVPYASDRAVPYQYNATMLENGQEVPLPMTSSVVSIADVTKVTRSGRVFGSVFPNDVEGVNKKVDVPVVNLVSTPRCQSSESRSLKPNDDNEVLEQAYVEHDITVDQFDHIVANITSCNNLSFCDEELPEEGAPMTYSGVIVKAFDGSRKTVIGEVDLPVKIGPSDFQITFQVMDIHPAYSFLLGRPWIHEAGAVTSILHQKLKFVKNGKLVIVSGEKALLVSHMSSLSYVKAEDEIGTPFQALSIAEEKRVRAPMSSFKDA
ncbi:hypothetical protein KIW84_044783 [Lathyrus oleraceus]|uniref:Uncharacterized protein n=1 Tax=Pisum sativum TaxID=3888 RepID=A0A9D5ATE0_PEA|nr:hypothetical protein KIW84_044783 [Pisum sativum]